MTRKQRREANRRNAQLSTGPTTPEGKARSAQNATSHGLSSTFYVLAHEDRAAFDRLLQSYIAEFEPGTGHEHYLICQMTESRWRLDRTRRFETIALDQIASGAFDETNPDARIVAALSVKTANILDLLQRYASAAERSYYRAHRELTEARTREKRNEAKEADIWIKEHLESPSLRDLGYPPRSTTSTTRDLCRTADTPVPALSDAAVEGNSAVAVNTVTDCGSLRACS